MRHALSVLLLAVVLCPSARADEPPQRQAATPADIQKSMDSAMGAMAPMMARMTEATVEAQLAIAERPATATRIAAFKHNLYVELQKQGFTPTQALQITLTTALPSAAALGK